MVGIKLWVDCHGFVSGCIGQIAKNTEDAQIIFNAIYGHDVLDSTSIEFYKRKFFPNKLSVYRGILMGGCDEELRNFDKY